MLLEQLKRVITQKATIGRIDKKRRCYVSRNELYTVDLSRERYNRFSKQKHLQSVEKKFNKLIQKLKTIGYLDDIQPIIRFKIDTDDKTKMIFMINFDNPKTKQDTLFYFDLTDGSILNEGIKKIKQDLSIEHTYIFDYVMKKKYKARYWLPKLRTSLNKITSEIAKQQDYQLNNTHIAKLFRLQRSNSSLVGQIANWIPYVYADINVDNLLTIFDRENNPDYERTGKFSVDLDTAKTLGSIHNSLVDMIL